MKTEKLVSLVCAAVIICGPSASANDECDVFVSGPGVGADVQAAIDAANPGQTLCLDGAFSSVSIIIPASKVGLTLTSVDKNNPALLSNDVSDAGLLRNITGIDLENGAEGVTISNLRIEVISFAVQGLGSTSNITVMNNETIGAIIANTDGAPDEGWMVQKNKIQTDFVGVSGLNAKNMIVKDNEISFLPEIFGSERNFLAGVYFNFFNSFGDPGAATLEVSGNKAMDNVVSNTLTDSRPKIGVFVDNSAFAGFESADIAIEDINVQRNIISGVDVGLQVIMVGGSGDPSSVAQTTDFDALRNEINCDASSLNSAGIRLEGGDRGFVDDVQLINNKINGCDADLVEAGNVSGVRVLGNAAKTAGVTGMNNAVMSDTATADAIVE